CRKNNITISDLMAKVNREKSEMKKENGNEKNEE
ncbi:TPA: conjugal transfer protein, partial [Clostridioides difficile]